MRRQVLLILGLLLAAATLAVAAGTRILLVARDLEDHPLSGFRFAFEGVETRATTQAGATKLALLPEHQPGQPIKIFLLPGSKQSQDWFLVNPQLIIPSGSNSAEVVLMRRSAFRQVAAEARDMPVAKTQGSREPSAEDRRRVLIDAAARYGLSAEQLETALRSFAETQDPKDRGIAAYLKGQYSQAEEFLNKATEKQESDLFETLRYKGIAQYKQSKDRVAVVSFRKAIALYPEDSNLLSWLGDSLDSLGEWTEAERVLRKALAIDEKILGTEHPTVAKDLNNLALVLQSTNQLTEAESLMRRALAIDEEIFGKEDFSVAITLNNLAVLLQATNRLTEAESLMRQALAIEEESFGPENPLVATTLDNLALLLQATNRLAEAEPLMRRALAIDEKRLSTGHANVARDLRNLAQTLKATNHLAEAEPLMRRGLVILHAFKHRAGYEHRHMKEFLESYRELLTAMGKPPAEIEATIKELVEKK